MDLRGINEIREFWDLRQVNELLEEGWWVLPVTSGVVRESNGTDTPFTKYVLGWAGRTVYDAND